VACLGNLADYLGMLACHPAEHEEGSLNAP